MRVLPSLVVSAVVSLSLIFPAAADPPVPAGADDVALVLVKIDAARKAHDVAAIQALVKVPAKQTWRSHDPGGDCNVAHTTTLTDPMKAATALAPVAGFVTALARDKGRAHQGSSCDAPGERAFSTGDPAIVVTGDSATVTYQTSICGAGNPTHAYTLVRDSGAWRVTTLDDGCHD